MKTKEAIAVDNSTIDAFESRDSPAWTVKTKISDITNPETAPLTENILPGSTGSNAAGMTVADNTTISMAAIKFAAPANPAGIRDPFFVKLAASTATADRVGWRASCGD